MIQLVTLSWADERATDAGFRVDVRVIARGENAISWRKVEERFGQQGY